MKQSGHLYVVEFSTRVIKVGVCSQGSARVEVHRRSAIQTGISVVRSWESDRKATDIYHAETALLHYCALNGTVRPYSNEYFDGLNFEDTVNQAKNILSHIPTVSEAVNTSPWLKAEQVLIELGIDQRELDRLILVGQLKRYAANGNKQLVRYNRLEVLARKERNA